MNMSLTAREVRSVMLQRIQRADVLTSSFKEGFLDYDIPGEIAGKLAQMAGSGWRHDCWSERTIFVPTALIVPHPIDHLFSQKLRWDKNLEYRPLQAIDSQPYYLVDILVFHKDNLTEADVYLKNGWRHLNILECAQALAQSCVNGATHQTNRGLGGLTTKASGIKIDQGPADCQFHLFFDGSDVFARSSVNGLPSEKDHHVAICRCSVDLQNSPHTIGNEAYGSVRFGQ